jgi:alkanesulfonate monooxygenase SsuD/methylene tetrahydromethanopterin reductase-like flavin-dependent oxidoreductase (luciferase family)
MEVGVLVLPADPWPSAVAHVRRLEALGFDHLWTYDHLSWRRYRDRDWHAAIPWLTGMAAATSRMRVGTMVATPNFRHPVTLAKEAVTLDHVSAGRFTLGLGAGGVGFDSSVLGREVLPARDRVARFAEFVELLDRLLSGPNTSHRGRYYTAEEAQVIPRSVQRPHLPLAVAAGGPVTLGVAARHGDAWITYGDTSGRDRSAKGTEAAVREQAARLDDECAAIGRHPASLRRIYLIGNTDERPLTSVAAFTDFAGRYSALGFTDLVFHHPRPGDPVWNEPAEIVEQIAADVLPAMRRGQERPVR